MTTPLKQQKILVDLKVAMNNGYCGIAKENRLVFKMLAQAESTALSGILVSSSSSTVFAHYRKHAERTEEIEQANHFFHDALGHELTLKNRVLRRLKLTLPYAFKKTKFDLFSIDSIFNDVIWRTVFDKSLSPEDRELILRNKFLFTDLSSLHLGLNSYFKRKAKLNTAGYDFAVFLEPVPISVSPGTTKIVRYHDAIPITEPDFAGARYSYGTMNTLKHCVKDSYFVCNSEPTRQVLLNLHPELEARVRMIPSSISSNYSKTLDQAILKEILITRMSSQVVKPEALKELRAKVQGLGQFKYIFNLATLDPKKNHLNLIKAWEKLNYQNPGQLKLIIAANSGWFSQEIEDLMRPHVELGNIIHVDKLTVEELPYLFSHAQAFVFPSFIEGFGLPPLEAMQCGCPVIVSDIPAHRWVIGEAGLYCDPYNPDSILAAMLKLCILPDAEQLGKNLSQKGLERVNRYTEATLAGQWRQLFEDLNALTDKP